MTIKEAIAYLGRHPEFRSIEKVKRGDEPVFYRLTHGGINIESQDLEKAVQEAVRQLLEEETSDHILDIAGHDRFMAYNHDNGEVRTRDTIHSSLATAHRLMFAKEPTKTVKV